MIYGNWVAIHKGFTKHLPKDRKYTPLEAMFSISVDIDNNRPVSLLGCANLWKWNRKTVRTFLEDNGIEFFYPESTGKKQNQKAEARGQIRDRSGTDQGQIRYIVDGALYPKKYRNGTDKGQKRDTTIKPDPETEPKINTYSNEFEETWKITPKRNGVRQGKKSASELFEKLSLGDKRKLYKGLGNYSAFLMLPSTEQNAMDLERFIRKRFFDDYQERIKPSGKNTDQTNSKLDRLRQKTEEDLNGS